MMFISHKDTGSIATARFMDICNCIQKIGSWLSVSGFPGSVSS